jgi:hypothetical protein
MTARAASAAIPIVAILGFSSGPCSQPAKTPTLGEILRRLEANLSRYDTGLPSIFCDEHAVSRVIPTVRDQDTVTQSIFRVKRMPNPDHTTTLVESREIKTVDGKPAISQKIDGPTLLSGAFEGALAVVSLTQTACMNYTLERANRAQPDKSRLADPYVVRFATVLTR